jgi:glycopeptide antibiotics resistance protein
LKSIHRKIILTVTRVLFVLYIILLAYFCFFSERYGRTSSSDEYRYNLILFKELKRFITYRKELGIESFVVNIIGNVLAFAPFGFALPIISPQNRKFFHIAFLSFEFSLTIELIQFILKVGIFDVDDLFLNTVGGMIGGICFFICNGIFHVMRHNNQNR